MTGGRAVRAVVAVLALAVSTASLADPIRLIPSSEVEGRLAIEVGKKDDARVIPLGDRGFAVLHLDRGPETDRWQVLLMDPRFAERARFSVKARAGFRFGDAAVHGDTLYVALTHGKRVPRLLRVPVGDALAQPTLVALEVRGKAGLVQDLEVVDDDVYLRLVRKGRGRLLHSDPAGGQVAWVDAPAVLGRKPSIMRLSPSGADAQVDITGRSKGRERTLAVAGVRDGLVTALRVQVAEGGMGNVLDAQRTRLNNGTEMLVGTYARGERGLGAQGLFLARYNGAVRIGLTTHSFTDFSGFFDHLRDAKQQRVERRAKRKKARGGDLKLNLGVILHDVIEQPDQFVVVGEAYYAEYTTYTTTQTTYVNGVAQTTTVTHQVFQGFRRTHAFVAAFDREGNRRWESSLPMGDVLTSDLRKRVQVHTDGDDVQLRYVYGRKVISRGVRDGQNTRVVEKLTNAKSWRPGSSDSAFWFDDRFLAWGFQKVKNKEKPGKKRMFFVAALDSGGDGG